VEDQIEEEFMEWRNEEFDLGGVNHLALVCSDMERTVEFYTEVLGMRLIKTIDLPAGQGQHFFFDMGGGNALAFFWFPDAPDPVPGVSAPVSVPGVGEWHSAVGSMNHIAFNVPVEKFDDYVERLKAKGVAVSPILNHDNSPNGVSRTVTDDVFVRSIYFFDPDGVCLEFACWTKVFDAADVAHDPMTADGTKAEGVIVGATPTLVPAE
jgi:catechol 2,3-dioxygenase-like lactoylglutathione lyase family enzyme